ncbi:MAG TPA: 5-deoxy-glucuronate isomerase [Ktedonobacteraceae bacterium]
MHHYYAHNLIVRAGNSPDPRVVVEVTPEMAGWEYISFQVRQYQAGSSWSFATGDHEMAIVVLSGSISVESNRGQWTQIGERENVFQGLPSALYLSRQTSLTVYAESACEYAVALAPAEEDHEPRLVTPRDIAIEIRGSDHATRQINSIIPPGFPCQRLVVVEVYTPGGNWSSYPPHKHDVHKLAGDGTVLEADLEEVYFYKLDRPEGFAVQRVYTDAESPLQQAGHPIDELLLARNNDAVLVPEGYHPVSSPPGYTTYYLNVLAGSAQSLANSEDSRHTWVKETYQTPDPRVPVYDITRR